MPTIVEVTRIDEAFDRLNTVLDASGALGSAATQHAAYTLRLAIVSAIGDPDRIQAAEAPLVELGAYS